MRDLLLHLNPNSFEFAGNAHLQYEISALASASVSRQGAGAILAVDSIYRQRCEGT